MSGISPTQNSLKNLRGRGYLVAITEYWGAFDHRRHDLFGFGDLLAVCKDEVLMVQCTSDSNVSARVHKITNSELVGAIREAGIRIEVHGWKKNKAGRWEVRIVDLS